MERERRHNTGIKWPSSLGLLIMTSTQQRKIYEPDTYYKFSPFAKNWVATQGVMQEAEDKRCYWLLDMVASWLDTLARCANVDYLIIVEFKLDQKGGGVFTIKSEARINAKTDAGYITHITQELDFTDLKQNIKWWAICETPGDYDPKARTVLLLPEEY